MVGTRLGFEVGSGKEVTVSPSHLIVTGVTQLSGKTTTLEALIKRSESRAVVFRTKIGEKGFSEDPWDTVPRQRLETRLTEEYAEYFVSRDKRELLDIINIACFIALTPPRKEIFEQ